MMQRWSLVGSSATLEGIQRIVREFWVSDKYTVDAETLCILHPTRDMSVQNTTTRVILKKGRYRFERARGLGR